MYKQLILLSSFFKLCFGSGVTIDMACVIPEEGIVHSIRHAGQDLFGLSLSWTDDGLMPNDLGDYPIDIQFEANVNANLRVSIDGADYINGSAVKFQIGNENEIVVPFDIEMESDKQDVQINLSYFIDSQLGLNYSGDYTAILSLKIDT